MRQDENIETFGEVLDGIGTQRLMLKFVERKIPGANKAYDFHSLEWQCKNGDEWSTKTTIRRADFEKGAKQRRWVSEIHSLDSANGHAVLRVGEEQPPEADGSTLVEYSWRVWDLPNNRQVQVLRVCKSPFETVDGKEQPAKKR